MISTTGLGIRSDEAGDGHFGADRTGRPHGHGGIDLLCISGQPVVFPVEYGKINRIAYPYPDKSYLGVEIFGWEPEEGPMTIKMFYMVPFQTGKFYRRGEVIGFAQDISKKYGPPMLPHIHLEVRQNGKLVNPETILEIG